MALLAEARVGLKQGGLVKHAKEPGIIHASHDGEASP